MQDTHNLVARFELDTVVGFVSTSPEFEVDTKFPTDSVPLRYRISVVL